MIEKYNAIETKLLLLAKKKSIAEISKDEICVQILNEGTDVLSFLLKRLSYKLLILSCYWPLIHNQSDDLYEPSETKYPQDIATYIDKEDETYLFNLYNKGTIKGVYADGLAEDYIKIITVIANQKLEFPTTVVSAWAGYLQGLIKDKAWEYIYATGYNGYPPIEKLAQLLNATIKHHPDKLLPSNVITDIENIAEVILSCSHTSSLGADWKLINSIHTVFGLGSKKYLLNNRNWTFEVINFINERPNKAEWETLLFHFGTLSTPKPSKKWLSNLEGLLASIDSSELVLFYEKTVESIVKEIPIEYPFSATYNLNVVRGLVKCIEYQNPDNSSVITLKLVDYCFQKIPDQGTHLPSLAKVCISALAKENDDTSIYGLHKLRGDYQKKSIKVSIRLLNEIESSIKALSKLRGVSASALKERADVINEDKPVVKVPKQTNKQLSDKQILKEIKRLGLNFTHRKTAINNDYASPGYRIEGKNVIELYIWSVKPKEVWPLIGELQNLIKVKFDIPSRYKTIRREIYNLEKLRVLDFSEQKVVKLSNNLFRMKSLETLNAFRNKINTIDQRISENTVLKSVELSCNKLTELPDEMANLKALEILSLSDNQLTSVPKLSESIKRLDISWNQINEISSTILGLKNLETLNLARNPIKEIPVFITGLKNLKVLNIRETEITEIPEFLANIEGFKRIFTDIEDFDESVWCKHNGSLIPVR